MHDAKEKTDTDVSDTSTYYVEHPTWLPTQTYYATPPLSDMTSHSFALANTLQLENRFIPVSTAQTLEKVFTNQAKVMNQAERHFTS